ncbi:MAG: hypothetical protein K2H73_09345, partial [Treponemataceae bacterium]|nr:hypothetical protein [Treponemataceae bacterium]
PVGIVQPFLLQGDKFGNLAVRQKTRRVLKKVRRVFSKVRRIFGESTAYFFRKKRGIWGEKTPKLDKTDLFEKQAGNPARSSRNRPLPLYFL